MTSRIILVGGTSSALAWLQDSDFHVRDLRVALTPDDLGRCVDILAAMNLTARREVLAVDKKRAGIIFAGAFWLSYLLKELRIPRAEATPGDCVTGWRWRFSAGEYLLLDFGRQKDRLAKDWRRLIVTRSCELYL